MSTQSIAYCISGPPSCGKTTTGLQLARYISAALLDLDSLTNPLVNVIGNMIGTNNLDRSELTSLVRAPRYEALQSAALDCVDTGLSTVLVAPFSSEIRREDAWNTFTDPLKVAGARPVLVWIDITPKLLLERLRSRRAERDMHKLADPRAFINGIDLSAPAIPHVRVNAACSAREQVQQITSQVA